ncbi:MAG TPA: type II toxin-antitoxin system RelE/ParE family toxin [Desulfitobacteriaceae bacterium]|jgi:addiction module RelE/StbE family toxin|nr:type II toxin-antitoxin system RelE/ParE family toxin [Desulfitobacteriaceae bacterium]
MNKLHYSPEALNDLNEIWVYIHNELQNPAAAQRIVYSILDTIERLRDFVEIGPLLAAVTEFENDYRFLVCGKYITFYRVRGAEVYIDRVLYGKRNYMRILFGTSQDDDDTK